MLDSKCRNLRTQPLNKGLRTPRTTPTTKMIKNQIRQAWQNVFRFTFPELPQAHTRYMMIFTMGIASTRSVIIQSLIVIGRVSCSMLLPFSSYSGKSNDKNSHTPDQKTLTAKRNCDGHPALCAVIWLGRMVLSSLLLPNASELPNRNYQSHQCEPDEKNHESPIRYL